MFALTNIDNFDFVNLKCNPEKAVELRETYNGIKAGYHMNKKHWNSVCFNSDVSDAQIIDLIDHSYNLVYQSLSKKVKNELSS